MGRRKVLYVCHNHPRIRPGGAEGHALELFEAMKRSAEFDPVFLARAGLPIEGVAERRGTRIAPVPVRISRGVNNRSAEAHPTRIGAEGVRSERDQYFFLNHMGEYDLLLGSCRNKEMVCGSFREFLKAIEPDLVHFQHTLYLGYDFVREVRNTLGDVPIVYTLHEYLGICHHHGQMVRTFNFEPCMQASPRRCHECFPGISEESFFLRKRFIQSHLDDVDLFLAPSKFLAERYIDWGIPREKIRFEDYGRATVARAPEVERRRDRFGFLGQLTPFKGADVLLAAMEIVNAMEPSVGASLRIHGANLDLQPVKYRKRLEAMISDSKGNVEMVGLYGREDLPRLMSEIDWVIVPSIWWENSPLVIQEAFAYGRPVICSGMGAMAEKVREGVDGIHFRAGDAQSLAETIARAAREEGLWEKLRDGIEPIYSIDEQVMAMEGIYSELLERCTAGVR